MHVTRSYLEITPGRAERETCKRYKEGILDKDFRSVRTFFHRVHYRHRLVRHPDTLPQCGTIVWLNEGYSALSVEAKEDYKDRFEQVKGYRRQNVSETELDGLIVWLKTKVDICSDRCKNDSTYALKQSDTSA